MLIIRLKPFGRKYRKHYRLVLANKRRHVTKKSILDLGWYNPYTKELQVKKDLLQKYIDQNVELSDRVKLILQKNSILKTK